jgi:hypothetical protein
MPFVLRQSFPGHEAHTVQWAGFKGLKNGALLKAAETAGYDVLLTVDRGIRYQQNPVGRQIAVVVMRPPTNQFEDLLLLVEPVLRAMKTIGPGETVTVSLPG